MAVDAAVTAAVAVGHIADSWAVAVQQSATEEEVVGEGNCKDSMPSRSPYKSMRRVKITEELDKPVKSWGVTV